jgi:uncharacterized ion transporter superfamily protein YfcC
MFKRIKVPHTLVLLAGIAIFALALTWILPAGQFDTVTNESGREVVQAGTFKFVEDAPVLTPWDLLRAVPRAFADTQDIIFFVLIVGGALAVVRRTGAIDALLGKALEMFGHRTTVLILFGMLLFTGASATLGMAMEYIPFVAILVSLCVALRLDTMTAIGVMVVGYGIGYGVSLAGPFTVLVAQEVAELQPSSGIGYRAALFVPFFLIGFHHVYSYAKRVQADPLASLVHDVPAAQPPEQQEYPAMTLRHVLILLSMVVAVGVIIYGLQVLGWYLVEMGAVFLALALLAAVVAGLSPDTAAESFTKGTMELTGTALLIGVARTVALIMEDGVILHTIVHYMSMPLDMVWPQVSAVGMLFIQAILNFFIPSGSGQAYVTMPLMAPIGDLVGVSRQVSVLAYQLGDGLMNMIVPTNAVLMGILGMAGIPYDRWFKFVFPLIIKLLIAASFALVIAVSIGYQ